MILLLHMKMIYLTHYLDRNLIIPAMWDCLFDMLDYIVVYKIKCCFVLLTREIYQRTHSVMNGNC